MDEELDGTEDLLGGMQGTFGGNQPVDERARLYELLSGMTEEQIQELIGQVTLDDEMGASKGDEGFGLAGFATPGAEGRNVGRTYVAASPLEHLAVGVRRSLGAKKMKQAGESQKELFGRKQRYAKTVIDMLRAMKGQIPEPIQSMPEEYIGPPEP